MLLDLLLADLKGLLLPSPVVGGGVPVVVGGDADKAAQRLHHRAVLHLMVPLGAAGEFRPLRRLHDHVRVRGNGQPLRVKVVFLASVAKTDRDDFGHKSSSHFAARPPNTWPTPTL